MVVISFELESWSLVVEALAVEEGEPLFAGDAVLAVVLDAAGRVLEADVVVEEVFGVTVGADSVGVLDAGVVLSLALVVVVDEEAFFTGDAFLPIAGLGDAGVFPDFTLAAAHDHVPAGAEFTVSIHVVLETAWLVLDAVESFPDVEPLGALDAGALLFSEAVGDLALAVH